MSDISFHDRYVEEGLRYLKVKLPDALEVESKSPSNIALVKYWGKYGNQYPRNPSISFSLTKSFTTTKILYKKTEDGNFSLDYIFNNSINKEFELKLIKYISNIQQYFPFLNGANLRIESQNTFPHSAGIASSASAFSSLAVSICNLEKQILGSNCTDDLMRKASFMARLGSGSACRSVYNGTVLWGETPEITGSSNEFAMDINRQVNDTFKKYHNAILIIDSSPKTLSSSEGHKLMNTHAFADARYRQAMTNLELLIKALSSGDELEFSRIVENEAMSLHSLIISNQPVHMLFRPNTISVIEKIHKFRLNSKLQFAFTLDAGPNIQLLYNPNIREKMIAFIDSELRQYCENGFWIDDKISG